MKREALKTAPAVTRLRSSNGVAIADDATPYIDRTGGRYGAGLIRGVSLCSSGEALGHQVWLDDVFLYQVFDAAMTNPKLLKSRFTHPDWCSDGMGKQLGTIEAVHLIDGKPYGDLHFNSASHKSPDGDLAEYVMTLAEEDAENFGLSIVFSHDAEAEAEFMKLHNGQSPDPLNINNYPHARVKELHAADVVDEPAANPRGLFHREDALLAEGEQLIDFVFGLNGTPPALSALGAGIAPERVREFVSKQLAKRGLSLSVKENNVKKSLSDEAEKPDDDEKKVPPKADATEPEKPDEEEPEKAADDDEEKKELAASGDKNELAAFCEALGHEAGAKAFLAGANLTTALTEANALLREQLADAHAKLLAFAQSGVAPVAFSPADDKQRDKTNAAMSGHTHREPDNRTKFAQANATASDTAVKA